MWKIAETVASQRRANEMKSAALVWLAMASLVACHRGSEEHVGPDAAGSSSAQVNASRSGAAASARGKPSVNDDESAWGRSAEPSCDPGPLLKLQDAIAHLYDEPSGTQIESVEHPVAYAYTALLRLARGDEAGSQLALHRIPYNAAQLVATRADATDHRIEDILSFVYETEYLYIGNTCPLPAGRGSETWCGIFDKYPEQALFAFKQQGGAAVDAYSAELKQYCAVRLVRTYGSPGLSLELEKSLAKITPALYAISEHPIGTGYSVTLTLIDDLLEEPIFGVSRVSRVQRMEPANFQRDVADARQYLQDIDARLARFRRLEAGIAPVLSTAYCKMAAHRGRPTAANLCRADADTRLESALQMWLEGRPYAALHYDAQGGAHEPPPRR